MLLLGIEQVTHFGNLYKENININPIVTYRIFLLIAMEIGVQIQDIRTIALFTRYLFLKLARYQIPSNLDFNVFLMRETLL